MFQPKCKSINYNEVRTTCQLLDRTVSLNNGNEISTQQEQEEFENQPNWIYYGQKKNKVYYKLFFLKNALFSEIREALQPSVLQYLIKLRILDYRFYRYDFFPFIKCK